ncbi:allophycocyanin subunit beta [Nostoc sp.]|uniref:allophycocyanin subunit beta n=1 Tax=Nostoc sp. TaxID=1180 RepID=UPI002FF9E657
MQDKTTSVVMSLGLMGKSLNGDVVGSVKDFLATGRARVQVASIIGSNASEIVKTAASQLFQEQPQLVRPGGNAYTTRRYNMYLRDMNYFLRYCSYALIAGDVSVLDERLLAGLRETFNSLGIPLGPTARSIQLMKQTVKDKLVATGITDTKLVDEPFDYVVREISETDVG